MQSWRHGELSLIRCSKEKEEETESRTYDLSKHLVTVTEVAEVDLEDEGTHLGPNQAGGSGRREGRFSSGE